MNLAPPVPCSGCPFAAQAEGDKALSVGDGHAVGRDMDLLAKVEGKVFGVLVLHDRNVLLVDEELVVDGRPRGIPKVVIAAQQHVYAAPARGLRGGDVV